jgi:hypothetical protein
MGPKYGVPMLEGRCVVGKLIISISLNGLKTVDPRLTWRRRLETSLRRDYSRRTFTNLTTLQPHNPFFMDSIEAGRPLTIDGTPQPQHPAI